MMRRRNLLNTAYFWLVVRPRERTSVLKQVASLLFFMIVFATVAQAQQTPPSSQVTLIRSGKLVDVDAGRVLANQMILVKGGKIEAIGEHLAVPAGATLIDLSKMTILRRLIDCITHLADTGDGEPLHVLQRTSAETAYAAIPNARLTLLAGFTTVRDVGVYRAFNDVAMRAAIARSYIIGPGMFVAGAALHTSEDEAGVPRC